jgi:hypothetical protein
MAKQFSKVIYIHKDAIHPGHSMLASMVRYYPDKYYRYKLSE